MNNVENDSESTVTMFKKRERGITKDEKWKMKNEKNRYLVQTVNRWFAFSIFLFPNFPFDKRDKLFRIRVMYKRMSKSTSRAVLY